MLFALTLPSLILFQPALTYLCISPSRRAFKCLLAVREKSGLRFPIAATALATAPNLHSSRASTKRAQRKPRKQQHHIY